MSEVEREDKPWYVVAFYTDPGKPPLAASGYCNRVAFYSETLQGFTGDVTQASAYPTYGTSLRVIHFDLEEFPDIPGVISPNRISALPSPLQARHPYLFLGFAPFDFPKEEPMPFGVVAMDPAYFYPIKRNPNAIEEFRAGK